MRILAACSLGGAGHFNPLVPFLRAVRRRGDEVLTVAPPALREMVESAGFPFRAGGEPPEEQVAAIRERLPVVPAAEASVLGNRELFGRLATVAMLAGMEDAWDDWGPELVLRDPTEYASAVLAARTRTPVAQVAISLAEAEAGSIAAAAPALEEHRQGLVSELRAQPYLTRFPASLDPSPFADTVRFHEPARSARLAAGLVGRIGRAADLPDLRHGPGPHVDRRRDLRDGAEGGRATERTGAVDRGPPLRRLDAGPGPGQRPRGALDRPGAGARPCRAGGVPWRLGDHPRRVGGRRPARHGAALRRPVRERSTGRARTSRTSSSEGRPASPRITQITEGIEAVLGDVTYRDRARDIAAEMAATATVEDVLARLPASTDSSARERPGLQDRRRRPRPPEGAVEAEEQLPQELRDRCDPLQGAQQRR